MPRGVQESPQRVANHRVPSARGVKSLLSLLVQSARASAARDDRRCRSQSLALQRLHPPQLAAARKDAARHRGGLHRHRRGSARRLLRPGEVRDLGPLAPEQGRDHAARHVGDGAERHVHRRGCRLEGPSTVNCSSHWFDAKDGVAAVGWYEQGVRFLDYRTPTEITQVGYYIPANGRPGLLLVADRPERRDRLHRRRLPRRRRDQDRRRRPDRQEGEGAGPQRVVRQPARRLNVLPAEPRLRLHVPAAEA
jgi:hypothetical protein